MSARTPENPRTREELWRVVRLLRPYAAWMLAGGVVALATLLANVGLMAVSGWFITSMAIAGLAGATLNYFTPAALIRLFAIVRTGGRYLERLITHEATLRLLASLRVWFYDHLEPLAPARLAQYRGADLANRIQVDIDTLDHFYLRVVVPLGAAVFGVAIILVVMGAFSVRVAVTTGIFLLLAGAVLPYFLWRRGFSPGQRLVDSRAALRIAAADGLQGLAELRVYGGVAQHAQKVSRISRDNIEAQRELSVLTGYSQGGLGLLANLAMWCAVILAIPLVSKGALRPPDLAMLALFALASFEAVLPLPQAFQNLGEVLTAARRLFEIVDAEPAVAASSESHLTPSDTALHVRDLKFRYGSTEPWVLDGLNLELPVGGRLALVGPSGAGKSSLVQVLLRFWDYEGGEIRLGGHDLRLYSPEEVRRRIAVVSQDAYIFNASVRENLLLARSDAGEVELVEACQTAQIHEFIMSLPQGYDTELGEGGALFSGGQARRIAVARALLMQASLLVLDEPTEGLDMKTERELLETLGRLMTGRSVLLITHRLEALASFFRDVAVLEQGRVVEQGTVENLMRLDGAFKRMRDAFLD